MEKINSDLSRKKFLNLISTGSLLAAIGFLFPFNKILNLTKNPKNYFRENKDSVKRQK